MTTRERLNKVLHWQKADKIPNVDFGYWDETIQLWHSQGLPKEVATNEDVERYLGLDGVEIFLWFPVRNGLYPWFENKTLETHSNYKLIQTHEGNICRVPLVGESIPQYEKYVLETRADWERLKAERLNFKDDSRIGDIPAVIEKSKQTGLPLRFDAGSLYGWLRNWMGVENVSIAMMTERDWIEEMMDHFTEMTLYLIDKTLPHVQVDLAWWWEDMCFNKGPLISPRLFEELMVPRYAKITRHLKKYHVDVNILDCDGCIYELVPGWLKAGINCMFPLEAAHTNPRKLREWYGRDVLLVGGVNKVELSKDRAAIDRELESLLPLIEAGGFVPCMDHRVPPDVSFENYLYYLEKKKRILG
ncbi:MAG: uroporphyrinogen decarboxylase family protein [Candidatus Zhuqueibacterota bacterium]